MSARRALEAMREIRPPTSQQNTTACFEAAGTAALVRRAFPNQRKDMNEPGFCEGDVCGRAGCKGIIETHPTENCSCHISPPCSACTAPRNYCPDCDWEEADDQVFNDHSVSVDKKTGVYTSWVPRPLDQTKIDWHSKPHSNSSMIKEGVYTKSGDDAADLEAVRKAVDGTFGGRFEQFGSGRFKFIAYTD